MKYIFTFLALCALSQVRAQLYDNMWLFDNGISLFHVDFREDPPFVSQKDDYIEISGTGNSVFSDEEGNLLFYTNSFRINNKIDSLLENGDSLNLGYYFSNNHYPVENGTFFLPAPGDSTRCYLIYMYPEKYPGVLPLAIKVQYSLIDRSANNGLGKVLEKNVPLMTGGLDFNFNHAGAVRHANGRDWWILVPNRMEPKYYRILLTSEGFSTPEEQEIGYKQAAADPNHYSGRNLFSPDGTRYAEFNYIVNPGAFPEVTGMLQFYDFDRCTGLLSNPALIIVPPSNPMGGISIAGLGFSPSGKRFYLSYGNFMVGSALAQYDMESGDIENSAQIVYTCPPGSPSWTCGVGRPMLALDGRVYVGGLVDTVAWHVIHHPDKIGAASHFEPGGGFVFPDKYAHGGAPYLPNYRLGPIDGSGCDTLGIDNHPLAGFNWEVADTMNPLQVEFTDNSFYEPTDWFWDFGGTGTSTEVNPLY
ncbi:MAG: PKD domain-containing protein, partial [Saprospiraceae bacterium]